mgnify:CR=1 FL=1|tara:strand:+ start:4637 stop:5281 length:645 start_codon:yes stop_codon:yes gene_type:complete
MLNVTIVESNAQYEKLFKSAGFEVTPLTLGRSPKAEDTDLVLFTGGPDVSPDLYGEKPHSKTYANSYRDSRERKIFLDMLDAGVPMVGICRGGQFLNVMNGGKMHQHVVGHATGQDHLMWDVDTKEEIMVSSTHHQMMKPARHGKVLATSNVCSRREDPKGQDVGGEWDDIEVVYYKRTNCLCFQPHPEFFPITHPCPEYFINTLKASLFEEKR